MGPISLMALGRTLGLQTDFGVLLLFLGVSEGASDCRSSDDTDIMQRVREKEGVHRNTLQVCTHTHTHTHTT